MHMVCVCVCVCVCAIGRNILVDTDGPVSHRMGGAIDCSHNAEVEIVDTVLADNTTTDVDHGHGGAIDIKGSTRAQLTRCTLEGNRAGRDGGAVNNWGEITLTDCMVSNNTAHRGADVHSASSRARTRQVTSPVANP